MKSFFYNTISHLRLSEEIVLYDKIISFLPEDEMLAKNFLQIEYDNEKQHYPYTAPDFDAEAALWAAKTLYLTCQLILYREHKAEELSKLFTAFSAPITASAMLSADLCLRFLPQALRGTKAIDPDDDLIQIAEEMLQPWHYSSIGYDVALESVSFEAVTENACLLQLYTDRVIERKDIKRGLHPELVQAVRASLGIYADVFWKELNLNIE